MGETTWSHQHKEWQKTLDLARAFGWDPPRKLGNHGGLLLKCPADDSSRHQIRIFSTGSGTESVAITARTTIRNCPHRDVTEPLARIAGALSGAERLLAAVDAHLLLVESEGRMADLLDGLDDAEEQLEVVQEEFDAAAKAAEMAEDDLDDDVRHRSPVDLADEAGSSLRKAALGLRDDLPRAHDDWEHLRARHGAAKDHLERIRHLVSR